MSRAEREYAALGDELKFLIDTLRGAAPDSTLQAQANAWASRIAWIETRRSELRVDMDMAAPPPPAVPGNIIPIGVRP